MGMAGWMAGRALREHGVGMHLKVYQAPAAMGPPTRGIGREQRDQQKTINPSLVVLWVSLSESCFGHKIVAGAMAMEERHVSS